MYYVSTYVYIDVVHTVVPKYVCMYVYVNVHTLGMYLCMYVCTYNSDILMYVRTCSDIVFIFGSLDPCTVFLEESVLWVVVALWTVLAYKQPCGELHICRRGTDTEDREDLWWGMLPRGHQGCRGSGLSADLPPRV